MRSIAAVSLAVVAACATSSSSVSSSSTPETMRVVTSDASVMTTSVTSSAPSALGAVVASPPDRVFRALRAVYDSLGIPVATVDAASRTIGNSGLRLKRKLGDVALSRYIDCGKAQGFPSADTYEVFLSVMTTARPDASGGTMVSTTISGQAKPITISGEPVRCGSLSTLESRIASLASTLSK